MYELIILSLLMRLNRPGYQIAKITNSKIGPWAKVSNGTLYPMMSKMAQAGLIERVPDPGQTQDDRNHSIYTITTAGRQRFHELMMDTASNLGDYQKIFRLKIPSLNYLAPRERLYLLNHYLNYCQASILFLQTEAENMAHKFRDKEDTSPYSPELAIDLMQHQARQWQAEYDWTMKLRVEVAAQLEAGTTSQ